MKSMLRAQGLWLKGEWRLLLPMARAWVSLGLPISQR